MRGDVDALAAPSVAIVGSRAATAYGLDTAYQLARDLARAGVVVVSGLARGIDGAAHRGALEAGGRTVAVLACGPDRVYPASHRGLARRIERQGAVVSELPLGTHPLPAFFPLRNRLISGMASAVVIVEARERSGSLITAGHAANQGVDVFAVPGPITAPTSAGPNRLLRDGAYVALEAADVLRELGIPVPAGASPAGSASAATPRAARRARAPSSTPSNASPPLATSSGGASRGRPNSWRSICWSSSWRGGWSRTATVAGAGARCRFHGGRWSPRRPGSRPKTRRDPSAQRACDPPRFSRASGAQHPRGLRLCTAVVASAAGPLQDGVSRGAVSGPSNEITAACGREGSPGRDDLGAAPGGIYGARPSPVKRSAGPPAASDAPAYPVRGVTNALGIDS